MNNVTPQEAASRIADAAKREPQLWPPGDIAREIQKLKRCAPGTELRFETKYMGQQGSGLVFGPEWDNPGSSRIVPIGVLSQ